MDKCKQMCKKGRQRIVKSLKIYEHLIPELNKKNHVGKHAARKLKKSRNDSRTDPKKYRDFGGGGAFWGIFGGPIRFLTSKWAHSTPKVLPMIEVIREFNPKIAQSKSESQAFLEPGPADCAKRLQ